jgi:hypothetical protein
MMRRRSSSAICAGFLLAFALCMTTVIALDSE